MLACQTNDGKENEVKKDEFEKGTGKPKETPQEQFARMRGSMEERKPKAPPKTIAEHTVQSGDTLSGIALKYYGNAGESYWKVIYNANKELIGDNPNMIQIDMKLQVPELPADLKS
jgi:nucleoid-associated protein YgaU